MRRRKTYSCRLIIVYVFQSVLSVCFDTVFGWIPSTTCHGTRLHAYVCISVIWLGFSWSTYDRGLYPCNAYNQTVCMYWCGVRYECGRAPFSSTISPRSREKILSNYTSTMRITYKCNRLEAVFMHMPALVRMSTFSLPLPIDIWIWIYYLLTIKNIYKLFFSKKTRKMTKKWFSSVQRKNSHCNGMCFFFFKWVSGALRTARIRGVLIQILHAVNWISRH